MQKCLVLTTLRLETGKVYPGATVLLGDEDAAALTAKGAVSKVDVAPSSGETAPISDSAVHAKRKKAI